MFNCQQITKKVRALEKAHKLFSETIAFINNGTAPLAEIKGAIVRGKELKAELEKGIKELLSQLQFKVSVPDSINPYVRLVRSLVPDDRPERAEKKEMTFDLDQEIENQCDIYASQNLEEWSEDIKKNGDAIRKILLLDPEEEKKIRARIKQGMVPVIMPSRAVQQATWEKALKNLKPVGIENGAIVPINDAVIDERYSKLMTQDKFFASTPERPYLVWARTFTKPSEDSNKDSRYSRQMEMLAKLHSQNPDLVDTKDITPAEYAALQSVYSHNLYSRFGSLMVLERNLVVFSITALNGLVHFLGAGGVSSKQAPLKWFVKGDLPVCAWNWPNKCLQYDIKRYSAELVTVARS